MPIAAISSNQAMPAAAASESPYYTPAPARTADAVSVSAEAKNLAAQPQEASPGNPGDLAMVHDFDPERIQRLLKLLE